MTAVNNQNVHVDTQFEFTEKNSLRAQRGGKFEDENFQRNGRYVDEYIEPQVQILHDRYISANAELDRLIAEAQANGDLTRADELLKAKGDLTAAYTAVRDRPPGLHHGSARFKEFWEERLGDLDAAISNAVGVASGKSTESTKSATATTSDVGSPDEAGATSGSEGADSWVSLDNGQVDDLVNMLANDPDAFMDYMSSLDPEQRNIVNQSVQMQLQQINQMNSMMTNFAKAMHDTNKAIINNFRV